MSMGWSETEQNELAVMPWILPGSCSTVTTVTPVANRPIALRNSDDESAEVGIWEVFEDTILGAGKAKRLRERVRGAQIEGRDNPSAAAACDIAILTVPFSGAAGLLKQLKSVWKPGTIVIDTTAPLAATIGGAATRVIGVWQGSAAEQTKELLPAGVHLAAAFQNLGAESLAGDEPGDCDVLGCIDHAKAQEVAFELVCNIPVARAFNGGKLENARIVESLTALLIGLNMRY